MESRRSVFDVTPQGRVTVRDALCALTAVNQDIQLLNYSNVVIRRGYQNLKTVRLLSGGVAGTDLSHAIFVGKGMLTAAILGEDAVPSSREILHTIKELNQGENHGIFVIVQANADVFNFELAVERANEDCRTRVKLLVIDDDKSERKERYTCGFILLVKILGAMAQEGAFFDEVYTFYTKVVKNIVTVSLKYSDVGAAMIALTDFEAVCQQEFKETFSIMLQPSVPIVALINTSKTLSRLTELGLVKQVIDKLREWEIPITRVYFGSFLTATPQTATLTFLKVFDPRIIRFCDAATGAFGWAQVMQFLPEISTKNEVPGILQPQGKQEIPIKGAKLGPSQIFVFEKAVQFACDALISCERQINIIDQESSKGNMGTRIRRLCEGILKSLENKKLPLDCPHAFLKKLGIMAESALGGILGSLYGVLFGCAANVFGDFSPDEYVTPFVWARAFSYAVNCMKSLPLNEEEMGVSMLGPIKSCDMAIQKEIERDQGYIQCFGSGVSAAEEAAQKTRRKFHEHPDAGAHAVGIWMRALFEAVKLLSAPTDCP